MTGPLEVRGHVEAPPSKSMMQRAIAAGLLARGTTVITKPTFCSDALAAIDMARILGAGITCGKEEVVISGGFNPAGNLLDCGESGLSVRMFAPLASLHNSSVTLTGRGSILKRPVFMIKEALEQLGAECTDNNGYLPLMVKGPLQGGEAVIDGSASSQALSGLLMALPLAGKASRIEVTNLKSRAYVDMTTDLLNIFNIDIVNRNYVSFEIPGNQRYKPAAYTVEGDWSGAAFLLVAGAIGGSIRVGNIDTQSPQPDKQIVEALKKAGAVVKPGTKEVYVERCNLSSFEFDATGCPDLFPPLVVLAAACKGKTRIKGAERLKYKESSRGEVLKNEFSRLGVNIELHRDEMTVEGGAMKSGKISSHNDHRIAMAAAVAAIVCEGSVTVEDAGCVNKSYPGFFRDFEKITGHRSGKPFFSGKSLT